MAWREVLQRPNAQGPPSIEYDELSRGNMFTYYDKQRHGRCPRRRLTLKNMRHHLDGGNNIKKSRAARFGGPLRQISPYLESEMINTRWAGSADDVGRPGLAATDGSLGRRQEHVERVAF